MGARLDETASTELGDPHLEVLRPQPGKLSVVCCEGFHTPRRFHHFAHKLAQHVFCGASLGRSAEVDVVLRFPRELFLVKG